MVYLPTILFYDNECDEMVTDILGVFSLEDKAIAAIEKYYKKIKGLNTRTDFRYTSNQIAKNSCHDCFIMRYEIDELYLPEERKE